MRGEGRKHVMPARLHADGARRYRLVVLVVHAAPNASHPRKPLPARPPPRRLLAARSLPRCDARPKHGERAYKPIFVRRQWRRFAL